MNEVNEMASKRSKKSDARQDLLLSGFRQDLLQQYGCGPIQFSGTDEVLYERHLLFDDIVAPTAAGAREQFEAAARSARDILSQRWVRTESTPDDGGAGVDCVSCSMTRTLLGTRPGVLRSGL